MLLVRQEKEPHGVFSFLPLLRLFMFIVFSVGVGSKESEFKVFALLLYGY